MTANEAIEKMNQLIKVTQADADEYTFHKRQAEIRIKTMQEIIGVIESMQDETLLKNIRKQREFKEQLIDDLREFVAPVMRPVSERPPLDKGKLIAQMEDDRMEIVSYENGKFLCDYRDTVVAWALLPRKLEVNKE